MTRASSEKNFVVRGPADAGRGGTDGRTDGQRARRSAKQSRGSHRAPLVVVVRFVSEWRANNSFASFLAHLTNNRPAAKVTSHSRRADRKLRVQNRNRNRNRNATQQNRAGQNRTGQGRSIDPIFCVRVSLRRHKDRRLRARVEIVSLAGAGDRAAERATRTGN